MTPATILQLYSNSSFNSEIITPLEANTSNTFSLLEFADLTGSTGALAQLVDANSEVVVIGVLWIKAGSHSGDVTTFALSDYSENSDTLSFSTLTQVDPSSVATFTITTDSTPEPTSAAFLVVAAGVLVRKRQRC